MKKKKLWKRAAAVLAASATMCMMLGTFSVYRVNAAAVYGDELVSNGSFDGYKDSFKTFEETNPGDTAAIPYTDYAGRKYDVYCGSDTNGGSGTFVKTPAGETYARLCYDGAAAGDSMSFWVQPGYLPAGTYTVRANIELVGFSTGDCFAMKYNGATPEKSIFNAADYETLPASAVTGAKVIEYTVTIDTGTEFPATMFWLFHKKTAGIEAHIYDISYLNAEGKTAYRNDFSEPFDRISAVDIPYGAYEDRAYGGIYCAAEGQFNTGYGQLVRARTANGNTETYARLYDNDKTSEKDTMSFWLQPGLLQAGDYTMHIDFRLVGNQNAQHLEFNVDNTTTDRKKLLVDSGEALAAIPESDGIRHLSLDYTLAADQQFSALNVWFWHGNDSVRELRIYEVEILDKTTGEAVYRNDFSEAFDETTAEVGSDKGFNDSANAKIVKEGENVVLRMDGAAAFNTPLTFDGVGLYRVEMDVKPSEDYTGKLSFFFAAADGLYNSATATVASKKSDFEFLDDSPLEGYVHYSTTILVNNFMIPHVLSLYTMKTGAGSVTVDNLSVKKKENSVLTHTTPQTEGLEFNDLVLGGDFEYLSEGYTFVSEPDESSYFWGSSPYDSPGKIVDLGGNKVLKIAYDPQDADKQTNRWASAFVFLDTAKFNTEDIFTLSYKYKYEGKSGFDPGIGLQVTFIGATGAEHLVQYLWYDALQETSGINTNEWPYAVKDLQDGWKQVTLTFKMDSGFISQVDSIRFLNYNNCDKDVVLYVDDVEYGVWKTPSQGGDDSGSDSSGGSGGGTSAPTETGCKNSKGCGSSFAALGSLSAVAAVAVVLLKKRKDR